MENKSNLDTRTFDYSTLSRYSQGHCGTGVIAPSYKVYSFGSHFARNTKPLTLCAPASAYSTQNYYRDIPYSSDSEFSKMMRVKRM